MNSRLAIQFLLSALAAGSLYSYTPSPRWAAATATAAPSQSPRTPRHLALLVGVGNYFQRAANGPHKPWPRLQVEEEIRQYAGVLERHYGFAHDDIWVLLDQAASKQGIKDAFHRLSETARPGDTVVFHFSGHGQRLPDDPVEPDEPDGLDESLVTYDATDQSIGKGEQANIRDDELAGWLRQLADRMRPASGQPVQGSITVTLDSCFSGSATRGSWTPRGRDWEPAQDGPRPAPRVQPSAYPQGQSFLSEEGSNRSLNGINVITAARADQVAWEHNGQGAFTSTWLRFLAQSHRSVAPTYHAAAQHISLELQALGVDQEPQALGEATRRIFSSTSQAGQPLDVRVMRDAQNTLWLSEGEVHGVTLSSRYGLYPAGAPVLDATTQQAEAEVDLLTPFSARLRLRPSSQKPLPGSLVALEREHVFALSPLRVVLSGFQADPAQERQIRELSAVQVVAGSPGTEAPSVEYDLLLRLDARGQHVQLLRPTADAPHDQVSLLPAASGEIQPTLAQVLLREWRWRHFARLRREDASACVQLEVVPVQTTHAAPTPASYLSLARKDEFSLRLHNRSARPLYAAVLGLSPDGDIDVMVGDQPGKNRIEPGATWGSPGLHWRLSGQPGDRVLLKVIATDQFVDFMPVQSVRATATTRSAGLSHVPENPSPLLLLLQGLATGPASGTRGGALHVPTAWGTTDAAIRIR